MTPGTIPLPTPNAGAKLRSMVGAVIYIRVSTKEQTENLSLPTQLRACEEYCHREGFEILERFKEEGESAKTADRTELQRLLTFCRTNKGKVHFVVVFNLTRFARDTPPPKGYGVQASTTTSRWLTSEVPGHLVAVGEGADRRHIDWEVDGRCPRRVRAIRQRRALRSHARRH